MRTSLVAPMTPLCYFNGRHLPQTEAGLALHDAGFVMGATVTDLCRTVHHRLYRWDDHFARFRHSCRAAKIYPPVSEDEITRIAHDLVAHNTKLLRPQEDPALD